MKYIILSLILLNPVLALSCDCKNKSVVDLIEESNSIFAGKAIESLLIEGNILKTTFNIIEVFKGDLDIGTEKIIYSHVVTESCDVKLNVGKSHVVLIDKTGWVTSCCSYDEYYSKSLSDRADITYRGVLKKLRAQ